ncbi:MAG: inositol monophosphatase family protein [Gemmatimonadaceae bacterium]
MAAAAKAADVVRAGANRRDTLTWESKGAFDFVSEVDRASEETLAAIIRGRHPDATLLAEEGTPDALASGGLVFVADPLDGTTNFLHGVPWYAVSIAALVDGIPQAGVVINVPSGAIYTATRGGGARMSGQAISVTTLADPSRALIATGFPFADNEEVDRYVPLLPPVMRATSGMRRFGAAALDLACVAAGRFDAFFELSLNAWDLAAGMLMVQEAGGIVTRMDGSPIAVETTSILAGGPAMHAWLLETLAS